MRTKLLLTALAVAALMALGAGSANATTLCELSGNECPAGFRYKVPENIQAPLTPKTVFKLVAEPVTVECNESMLAGETYANVGPEEFIRSELGVWSLSHKGGECVTAGGGKCPVTKWTVPILVNLISAGGNGVMSFYKGAKLEVTCGGVKCIYATTYVQIEFQGGGAGEAVFRTNGMKLEKAEGSNFLCGKSATVNAEYTVTAPAKALWIAGKP